MHRSHHAIKPKNIMFNKTTGEYMLSHNMSIDGYYKGRKIVVAVEKEA